MIILKTETHTRIFKISGTFDNYDDLYSVTISRKKPFRNDFSHKKLGKLYGTAGIGMNDLAFATNTK